MAEIEIEWQQEELWQNKGRDDRLQAQANWHLKEKHADFETVYRDHKENEKDFKPAMGEAEGGASRIKGKEWGPAVTIEIFQETKKIWDKLQRKRQSCWRIGTSWLNVHKKYWQRSKWRIKLS